MPKKYDTDEVRQGVYTLGAYAVQRVNAALRRNNDEAHGTTTLSDELNNMSPSENIVEAVEFEGTPIAIRVMGLFYGPTGGQGAANRLAYAHGMGIKSILKNARAEFQEALATARLLDTQLKMDPPTIEQILRRAGDMAESGEVPDFPTLKEELNRGGRGRF